MEHLVAHTANAWRLAGDRRATRPSWKLVESGSIRGGQDHFRIDEMRIGGGWTQGRQLQEMILSQRGGLTQTAWADMVKRAGWQRTHARDATAGVVVRRRGHLPSARGGGLGAARSQGSAARRAAHVMRGGHSLG
ncbi:hypothetical protein PSPO01_13202 [Paraphaeosphaeria sporulosa]